MPQGTFKAHQQSHCRLKIGTFRVQAYQRDDDEGGSRDGSTHVGPDAAAVQDAHPPGQLALEQGAHLGVEHDLEVTLHHMFIISILVFELPVACT